MKGNIYTNQCQIRILMFVKFFYNVQSDLIVNTIKMQSYTLDVIFNMKSV